MPNINSTMKKRFVNYSSLVVLAAALLAGAALFLSRGNAASGGKDSNPLLVSTAWLGEHSSDRGLVIISVRPRASYDAGHIPGARFIEMSAISSSAPGSTLEMPPVDKLKSTFEDLGVSNNSRIVICFLTNYVSPSTRVFFTLDYLGLGGQTDSKQNEYRHPSAKEQPFSLLFHFSLLKTL